MPVEVVREPLGKTVLKNSGTNQNVLVLFQNFQIKGSGTHQNVMISILSFGLKRNVRLPFLDHIKTFWFCPFDIGTFVLSFWYR